MNFFEKDAINNAVSNWFRAQCRNTFKKYYLYCKIGAFTISDTKPDGMEVVSDKPISIGWTKEVAARKVYEMLCKAPCWNSETGLIQWVQPASEELKEAQ